MSWTFFREFLLNWKTTGAIAPSSPALARLVVSSANVAAAGNILEVGTGTGAFTGVIHDLLPPGARYLGLDLNKEFIASLKIRFPFMRFEAVAAQEFDYAAFLGADARFDTIISGLPWAAFPEPLQISILDHVLPWLRPGGTFVTFAYTGFHLLPAGRRFRTLLQRRCLHLHTTRTVFNNLPPAFVYQAVTNTMPVKNPSLVQTSRPSSGAAQSS